MMRSFYTSTGFMVLFLIGISSLFLLHCGSENTQKEWIPDLASFDEMEYKKVHRVWDTNHIQEFEVTIASSESSIISTLHPGNFSIEILLIEGSASESNISEGAGVFIDGEVIEHNHDILDATDGLPSPPPLFFKIHAVGDNEPQRFLVQFHDLPPVHLSVIVNAGHYKSIVLRRSGSGSSYVKFYHHHGDWSLHILYQGYFTKCTYAYDCYAGHSIPSWWTSKGDESIEYRADCYGRCP